METFKKFLQLLFFLTTTILQVQNVSSENILVVAFAGSKSHKNAFEPLYIELAKRGHKLTVIHPVKSNYEKSLNIKEINGVSFEYVTEKALEEIGEKSFNAFSMREGIFRIRSPINPMVVPILQKACSYYYEMPEVQAVLKQKFALVFMGAHMNECAYGLVAKLNTSYIFVQPHGIERYKQSATTGFYDPTSFVPTYALGRVADDMNFVDRTLNFLLYQTITFVYDWLYIPPIEETYRKYLGDDMPSVREIEANASMIFHNSHFSLSFPRPQMPQIIDLGGMHCTPGKPLPKDLQDFVDSSGSEGFIYFSMGSHVKGSDMPEATKQAFVKAFSKLKQKVIWKWDQDKIDGLSSNVKLVKWAPQQDLLASPKIRAFISHGGLLSTQEASYHGVPIIGFAIFGDQDFNMKQAEHRGFGIALEITNLTEEKLLEAVNKVLKDKSYVEAGKTFGKIFKDRQTAAVETAVYWSEYVIRHKGAIHLRSPATKLNFFAYYSLDSLALICLVLVLSIYIPVKLCKLCFCGRKKQQEKKKTKSSKKNN